MNNDQQRRFVGGLIVGAILGTLWQRDRRGTINGLGWLATLASAVLLYGVLFNPSVPADAKPTQVLFAVPGLLFLIWRITAAVRGQRTAPPQQ